MLKVDEMKQRQEKSLILIGFVEWNQSFNGAAHSSLFFLSILALPNGRGEEKRREEEHWRPKRMQSE